MQQSDLSDYQTDGTVDHTDPDVLSELYHEKGLSMNEIGDRAGVTAKSVEYHMKKHGIERRNVKEATRKAHRVEYATFTMNGNGYHEWQSRWRGEADCVKASRLLAVAEHGFDAIKGKEVHHKNGIKWLDYPDNIALLDPGEHRRLHRQGEGGSKAKLSREEAEEIKRLANRDDTTNRGLAEQFGVSYGLIGKIKNGKRWTHLD